ncbi:mCG145544, partial [Mus musculus]
VTHREAGLGAPVQLPKMVSREQLRISHVPDPCSNFPTRVRWHICRPSSEEAEAGEERIQGQPNRQ